MKEPAALGGRLTFITNTGGRELSRTDGGLVSAGREKMNIPVMMNALRFKKEPGENNAFCS